MAITNWRFGEDPEDGEAWLRMPTNLCAYVEYETDPPHGPREWRRLMVVTRAWLQGHLDRVLVSRSGPLWAVVPTVLVVPDAQGEELRRIVDTVIKKGGFDNYSTPC